jgi:hypothetical protein
MISYYKLSSTTMNPCTMVKPFREEAQRSWLCPGCGNPRQQGPIDVSIQEKDPDDTPLNMISGCTVGIAQNDFLFTLGEEVVRQHLYLGRVISEASSLLEGWSTFLGRYRIIIRGSKNAAARRCSECGNIVYFAMGEHYLYPRPREDVAIFHAGLSSLVVSEELVRRINQNEWQKLDCMELPVLDAPKDGLADLQAI